MPVNGKLFVGEVVPDWMNPPGVVTVVVRILTGQQLETPINTSVPYRGSSAEQCAIYGGAARWTPDQETATP